MEKVTHINDLIGSLPKMTQAWEVYYKNERKGTVRAYSERQAYGYISRERYPERDKIVLRYIGIVG